jgi:osmotically-inducible protein OsmY
MRDPGTRSIRFPIILFGVLVAAGAMNACARGDAAKQEIGAAPALERPTDSTITQWVQTGLHLDPRVSDSDVKVSTVDGIVQLRGSVNSVQEKRYAKLEVKKIAGVRGVIDEISVRPSQRPDATIREDVVRRLTHNPGVHGQDVDVTVEDGKVTLNGTVATWNELEYATTLAGEVQGVREVVNDMLLAFERPRTDAQNRDEIVAAIDRDAYLAGLPITVRVSDGIATLDGTVGNAFERDRAEYDVRRVASVDRIDNRLGINWTKDRGVRDHRPAPTDDQVRSAVRDTLSQDLRLTRPDEISITVRDSDVILEGLSPDYYQKTTASQDARDVVGVRQVLDLVQIDLSDRRDAAVADSLKQSLNTDYVLADTSIDVFVDDGIATLTGVVQSPFAKEHAEDVATSILGVRDVINDIVVSPSVGYSDEALKERIEDRLEANWLTRPVAPRIHVVVEDGIARLTGDLDSWIERMEAARVTRLVGGVTGVTNDLTVYGTELPAVSRLDLPADEADGE